MVQRTENSRRLRAVVQAAAYALLAKVSRLPGPLSVSAGDELFSVRIEITPLHSRNAVSDGDLTAAERRILAACRQVAASSKRPATAVKIAHVLRYRRASTYLYDRLRSLCDKGYLDKAPGGGYRVLDGV
jgi:hypothetical protein